jgi:hypothetical protein
MDLLVEKEDAPIRQKDVDHVVPNPEATAGINAVQHATDADKLADQGVDGVVSASILHQPDPIPPIADVPPSTGQQAPQINNLDVSFHNSPGGTKTLATSRLTAVGIRTRRSEQRKCMHAPISSSMYPYPHCTNLARPSTISVRSSVYAYIEENGRRYHKYKEGSKLI